MECWNTYTLSDVSSQGKSNRSPHSRVAARGPQTSAIGSKGPQTCRPLNLKPLLSGPNGKAPEGFFIWKDCIELLLSHSCPLFPQRTRKHQDKPPRVRVPTRLLATCGVCHSSVVVPELSLTPYFGIKFHVCVRPSLASEPHCAPL